MIINHNMNALGSYRQLGINNANMAKSTEKLASGLRINKAGDDAAGLAISEKMRGQIRGLEQASRNAQDGISMIQTAEGALNETHSILQRMRELAVQSSNDSNTAEDRENLQKEIEQLKSEIDRIGNTTEFNTQKLLDGSKGAKTTSADLTGGTAINVSSTSPISIKDGQETQNNQITVVFHDDSATKDFELTLNLAEGNYNDLVSFTNAFNSALKKAADDLKAGGGTDITTDIAKFKLKFDVETGGANDGKVKFSLVADSTAAASDSLTVKFDGIANTSIEKALNIAADISVTADNTNTVTTPFSGYSQDVTGSDFQWDGFNVKVEDGLNATANQNNKLSMTYDGLNVNSVIKEGDYKTEASLEQAVKDAIAGTDTTAAAYANVVATPNAANWAALVADSKTYNGTVTGDNTKATGLVKAVDDMTDAELNAKGYNGNSSDMKAAYFKDLVSKAGKTLTVDINSDKKMTISGPAEMKIDETSQAASQLGLTNVNADIKNSGVTFQIGANEAQTMTISINDMRTTAIGKTTINGSDKLLKDINISTREGAQDAIKVLDTAIKEVSQERSKLGAYQNRLEHSINNLNTSSENLTAAESRIRDTDMAKTVMENTKNSILAQAAQAMLAQANQNPQQVLQLLR